mmetsp:Transcript_3362/g.7945  ORF Transcript_3362/g.7945 Transcript_3362/m.7945 type:complete len:205 (-) Transcript_3362:7-621(-)
MQRGFLIELLEIDQHHTGRPGHLLVDLPIARAAEVPGAAALHRGAALHHLGERAVTAGRAHAPEEVRSCRELPHNVIILGILHPRLAPGEADRLLGLGHRRHVHLQKSVLPMFPPISTRAADDHFELNPASVWQLGTLGPPAWERRSRSSAGKRLSGVPSSQLLVRADDEDLLAMLCARAVHSEGDGDGRRHGYPPWKETNSKP